MNTCHTSILAGACALLLAACASPPPSRPATPAAVPRAKQPVPAKGTDKPKVKPPAQAVKPPVKPPGQAETRPSPPAGITATPIDRPSPAAMPEPGPSPRKRSHIIRPGDTLTKLARAYGTTEVDIKSANSLDSDILVVGKRLVIPAE